MFRQIFRSLSRGRKTSNVRERGPSFAGSPETSHNRRNPRYRDDEEEDDDEDSADEDDQGEEEYSPRRLNGGEPSYFDRNPGGNAFEQDEELEGEDDDEDAPLLPIFSAVHLDGLPLYNITHAIRLLIVQKCETTLSWEQLRSPQISQFLVKPIQSDIRTNHFNRATLCALIANSLQFHKEGQGNPGNVGVLRTRGLISELLAMRLLREFSTWELIDSLSYDFNPLQGFAQTNSPQVLGRTNSEDLARRTNPRVARVSTIEIAIRAEAKRFLAHPLVVQHLEAIWAGTIVFHSEQDNLHRKRRRPRGRAVEYGTSGKLSKNSVPTLALPGGRTQTHGLGQSQQLEMAPARRSVTLYDPRDASLFKLSRLRVPRYRQVFSTLSFATMLALFVAILVERSLYITPLEVLFWFWSAAYMLDEVVGFTEQGFGLYILSFWNAFDLGILALFAIYYCLRLYGVLLAESGRHRIAALAYDVLASTAILLFPRLFGVLDHYRYFSQLLIAFRMMAQDLIAILILILIFCSGFFVAFTLSFADENQDANGVAYALFQIVMGFTPAAWDHWAGYNILGKAIMAIFLIICHFLIVTILITVLTNSFMAIVKNAEEEHQFLFAINTISMVKSDALFSYVAPTNIIGWVLSPLRFAMPLRQYVKFNRTIIKVTHFPVLFIVFLYERLIMARIAYVPTDLIEQHPAKQKGPIAFSINKPPEIFSPGHRMREASVISFRKDQALEEVFRRPFQGDTMRTTTHDMEEDRRQSKNVVTNWMEAAENEGGASPPMEQPRSVLERLEHRRPKWKRATTADRLKMAIKPSRDFSFDTRSVASDPDLLSLRSSHRRPQRIIEESEPQDDDHDHPPQETDADADVDENITETNEDSDGATPAVGESAVSVRERENRTPAEDSGESEYFRTPMGGKSPMQQLSHAARARMRDSPEPTPAISPLYVGGKPPRRHHRNASSGTILFTPPVQAADDSTSSTNYHQRPMRPTASKQSSTFNTGGTATPKPATALLNAQRPPKPKPIPGAAGVKARPIMPPRQKTAPSGTAIGGLAFLPSSTNIATRPRGLPINVRREPSFSARALDLASEIGDNKVTGDQYAGGISGMPASFSEQLFRERELARRAEEDRRRSEDEEKGMVNRIMLARMHTLEEGFREVLREIKDMSSAKGGGGSSRMDSEMEGSINAGGRAANIWPKLDTSGAQASGGSAAGTPKTPIGRIGGVQKVGSPRKTAAAGAVVAAARKNSKKEQRGKENERRIPQEEASQNRQESQQQEAESTTRGTLLAQDSDAMEETPLALQEDNGQQEEEALGKSYPRPTTAVRREAQDERVTTTQPEDET